MATIQEIKTFCRVCEPMCGVVAEVKDGRIEKIRSNPDHVLSRGHFCKKAMGAVDVTYDEDRLLYPMKRSGAPGEFTRITWEQAYTEIAERLDAIRTKHGASALATYIGNPPYYAYASMMAMGVLNKALDVKWHYGVNGEDGNALLAAAEYLFGSMAIATKPDMWKTSFLLLVGTNLIGSHGSGVCEPHMGKVLKSIIDRGGRVVVVDPRKTETAQKFEHIPIRAGSDAWFLTALLRELIAQGFTDREFIAKHTRGFEELSLLLEPCTPEFAELHCGIPAQTIRDLARDFGSAPSAAVHCRTGAQTQRYGTFVSMLLQIVSIVTGNLDRAGGNSFGWGLIDMKAMFGESKIGAKVSRSTGLPEIAGALPSIALVTDITQPGEDQIRALLLLGANPALQSPASGPKFDAALQDLELFFSIDLYMNETNRFADYILPGTSMWEREDVPFIMMTGFMLRASVYATPAVIERRGEVKEDWEIMYELCRRLGVGEAVAITPREMIDGIIRGSEFGDQFGRNPGGLSLDVLLEKFPDGVELKSEMPVGIFESTISTPDKRVDLAQLALRSEFEHMLADQYYKDPAFPLRAHTVRELLTHNSWMHNAKSLAKTGRKYLARIHPEDAARAGIADGDAVCIRSPYGEIDTVAHITDTESVGNVGLPHGWGHNGGWKLANRRGGVNSNLLASADPGDTDRIGASSMLNGIPVNIRRADARVAS
jgi:anaerobic selenocysteine-containing dehydrogenase